MNGHGRKRQATEPLQPLRATKHRRLAKERTLAGTPRPTEIESLASRWMNAGFEIMKLLGETIGQLFEDDKPVLPITNSAQSRPSIPPRPSAPPPPRRPSRPAIPSQFQTNGHLPDPPPPSHRTNTHQRMTLRVPPRTTIAEPPQPKASSSLAPARLRRKSIPNLRQPNSPSSEEPVQLQHSPPRHRRKSASNADPPPPPPAQAWSSPSAQGSSSPAHPALSPLAQATLSEGLREYEIAETRKKYVPREHILVKQHKRKVKETRVKDRAEMEKELFRIKQAKGFSSNFEDFQSLLGYEAHLDIQSRRGALLSSPSLIDLRSKPPSPSNLRRSADEGFLRRALEKAKASLEAPKPPKPYVPSLEHLRAFKRAQDEEIERRIHGPPLPTALPPDDDHVVDTLLSKRGVISKLAREQVTDKDLMRLRPNKWLNDEIINFYGQLIMARADGIKENSVRNGRKKSLKVHYFSTFFWSKLEGEGYEKGRLAKWTKKIDIFQKDVLLIPVNHSNSHWTAAAINFRRKRIESYDSMGSHREDVFKLLRHYLDMEHRNKKKKPFDFTGWQNYVLEDIPLQENGYDCGVFTCAFLEALSRGEERFRFSQTHMPYLRRRMVWEIGHAKLRDDS